MARFMIHLRFDLRFSRQFMVIVRIDEDCNIYGLELQTNKIEPFL